MERMIQHIYLLPLFISTVLSFRALGRKWPASYGLFSILLLIIFLVELLAYLWKFYFVTFRNWPYSQSNLWLYNSFLIPQYLLYMAVYYKALHSKKTRTIIVILAVVYLVFAAVNFSLQGIHGIDSYTLAMADGIVLFMTVAWFNQVLREKEIIRLTAHPMVWISVGAFIFHAANLPYILSLDFLIHNDISLAIALFYIFLALNCIMYSFYTIAFLCHPPPRIS